MTTSRRRGITLFEMIVVLMIVVIAGTLAFSSLNSMMPYYKANAAVDVVRGAWAKARVLAMEQGRPYRFSAQPGGSRFRVAPDREDYWHGGGGPSDDPDGQGTVFEESLPDGVEFSVSGAGDDNHLVFLPDGTANSNVTIVFRVVGAQPRQLDLRGLTGAVSVTVLR